MGFEAKTKTIGGKKFTVAPLPFKKGKDGLVKLVAVIAPALGEALSGGGSVLALLGDARIARFLGDMLVSLPSKLEGATLEWFETEFGACSTAEAGELNVALKLNSEGNRATVFESLGYMAYFEWLGFALEVNYSGFFSEALAKMPAFKKKPAAPNATPTP